MPPELNKDERADYERLQEAYKRQQRQKTFALQDHGKPGTKKGSESFVEVRYYRNKGGNIKSYRYTPKESRTLDSRSHKHAATDTGKVGGVLSLPVVYGWLKNEGFIPDKLADISMPDLPGEIQLWLWVIGLLLATLYVGKLGIKYYEEH